MSDLFKTMQNELVCTYCRIKGCDKRCLFCTHVCEDSEIISAYDAAIKALKSKPETERYRTPKKILFEASIRGKRGGYYYCPTCHTEIGFEDANESKPFCSNCGQALDWPEVKE